MSATVLLAAGTVTPAQVTGDTSARTAAVASARGEVNRARSQLQAAVAKVRTTWKSNPKLIEANDQLEAARKDFDAAKRKVIDRLKSDPTYAALLKTQADMQSRLRDEQAKTNAAAPATTQPPGAPEAAPNLPAPSARQVATAQEKLDNKAKLRNLEDQAIAADPDAAKAQDKLNEAQKVVKVWSSQLDAALQNDPDYKAAHDQLTSARSRLVAAGATDAATYDNYGETIYVR